MEANIERPTSNAECQSQKGPESFRIIFSSPNAGHKDSDQLVRFSEAGAQNGCWSGIQATASRKPALGFAQCFKADSELVEKILSRFGCFDFAVIRQRRRPATQELTG